MLCPKCGSDNTKVIATVKGIKQERTRKCKECGYIFQTVEVVKFDKYLANYVKVTQEVLVKEGN